MGSPVVLVLRSADKFSSMLKEAGCELINLELIRTEPLDDQKELRSAIDNLNDLDVLFFTSPVAAAVFVDCLRDRGPEFSGKIYVLGERTKRVFEDAGITVEFPPKANTAEELIRSFNEDEFVGKRFCFFRGDRSMRTIPELLKGKATVNEVIVYRTIENKLDAETAARITGRLENGEIDWACFFSPSAIEVFNSDFGDANLNGLKVAAIGETTAEHARRKGLKVAYTSSQATSESFAQGLIRHIKEN